MSGGGRQIANCIFVDNTAESSGGAIHNPREVANCLFYGNRSDGEGGAISCGSRIAIGIKHCTISGNEAASGGGVNCNDIFMSHSIVWGNEPNDIFTERNCRIHYSDIGLGCRSGVGNISTDPMFVNPEEGNFRLQPGSPCIDATGNLLARDLADLDEDGDTGENIPFDLSRGTRVDDDQDTPDTKDGACPVVDMGAYEFRTIGGCCGYRREWACAGDIDGNGQVNPVDVGLIQSKFGSTDSEDLCHFDVDCDGRINPVDSGIVQSLFGEPCRAPRTWECL